MKINILKLKIIILIKKHNIKKLLIQIILYSLLNKNTLKISIKNLILNGF